MSRKKNDLRKKWMTMRFTDEEYQAFEKRFKETTERNISVYARKLLLRGPIFKGQRNLSLDALMPELTELLKTLNGVANNFNQAVHVLHIMNRNGKAQEWVLRYDLDKRNVMREVAAMKEMIKQAAELWLRS